ncbi:MFS transporter [Propionibacterium freudenreichii]|nr:MFS transporter [Propionibacterium freudenreichii]
MGVSDKQTSGRNTEKARPSGGGSLAVLRRPVFLMLFVAQLVSNIGSWMQSVGAQWFLVEQAGSPALFAGVAADLVNRKRLLLTLSLVSAAIAVALTVVTAAGWLGPWELLGFTFILGCAAAIMGPAWQAIQPELVPREELPQASSLGSITVNGARAIGPAIAGIIVVASGPAMVFGINAVSFLAVAVAVAVALALVLWRRGTQQQPAVREQVLPGLLSGMRYVRSAPGIRRILIRCVLFAFPGCALWGPCCPPLRTT